MKLEENKLEFIPKAKISVIEATPTLSPEQFDMVAKNADAIVFIVYATGTSPEILNNVIKQKTEEDIPVFLVSKNPGDDHGIIKIIYDTQVKSLEAGVIPLQKVNVNNIDEICIAIQKEFSKGKKGNELGQIIKEKFSYKEGEKIPIPGWNNPIEIEKQKNLYRNTLKKMNLSENEIEKELKKWEGSI